MIREYAEIGSQAKLRIWCSNECKSSSLFTRIVNVLWLKLIIKIISPHHASLAELVQQLSSEQ